MRKPRVDRDPTKGGTGGVSRRDLFRLRRTADAAPQPPAHSTYDLLKATRAGMGSYFEIRVPFRTPGAADLATRALDRVEELEYQLTVYRDDSEVSLLNASAHLAPVPVERGLFDLLKRSIEISKLTGGAHDVTTGALSLAWGFTRGPKRVPSPEAFADALARTGYRHLLLNDAERTVKFDRPGIVINLGGIGKGHAVDEAARIIRDYWIPTSALIHGGRSSVFALGSPPDDFGGRWEVSVQNPLDPESSIGTFRLRNRGMGTSGAAFQQFEVDGRLYGHILDPRTGEPPADGPLSVSVLAPTAAEADALSTAFYLIGPEEAAKIIRGRPELGALFVKRDAAGQPRVTTIGLTEFDFQPNLLAGWNHVSLLG